ncbi:hypothetical protein [Nocardia tengchongensis]
MAILVLVKFADVICADTGARYTIPTEDGDQKAIVIVAGTR